MAYSPTLGRWIQTDPAGYLDGQNLYEYVRSNPASGVDPYGLFTNHVVITTNGVRNSGLPPTYVQIIANANAAQDAGAARNRPPFSDAANHGDNGREGIQSTIDRMAERWR